MKKLNITDFTKTDELYDFLLENQDENPLYKKVLMKYEYETELLKLQSQLVNLQNWILTEKKQVAIIFEGRDASGKGGTIRRFREHLNPRSMRVVALNKPTEVEQNQWYFNRYIKELPNAGELVFFDRSWYNRAVVEPVMGFCTEQQYEQFMVQVSEFEHMLYESGTHIIKLWFSVTKEEQQSRFDSRLNNPLKQWKYSPVDAKGQELWDEFSYHINQMFTRTHNSFAPWIIVNANNKNAARLETIRHVLSLFNYDGKFESDADLMVDPNIIQRYYRMVKEINL
ncbi:polyphosphate kinase 2, PA0141 family [Algoriella xinjiangensis]|uniref:ADP/GDP-polyphosphate phosphotransferase n=1 Tax=Algoriella xinjiangensis TaxID=684065 RepID=A0A1I4X7L2_9FLAO|nr:MULTISPECIES: polyphosphate kinase 2 [Algoriella]MBO6212147.1 polyphosphate kinase 2 [Algoriella sp.]SFN21968.1 polyphosphate kinase 2, PA0141 family [Algoriella xinjiangensis]VDH14787.1 polyphosphate kinase 2 [Algoriella xinjiangensis]